MAKPCLLIGDIGGTNARFALADAKAPGFTDADTLACADFETAEVAIRAYLDSVGAKRPGVICLAAAGPVVNDTVRFTNNHWSLGVADLQADFDTPRVRILNDFEAIAYSIPFLTESDCLPVGLPSPHSLGDDDFTIGIIGPGTGLGTGGLCRRDGALYPIVGEGGHVGFAPETQLQVEVLAALRERFDRVSAERLVSGPGLENIYWALTRVHGEKGGAMRAADIFAAGSGTDNPRAAEAVQLFFETLGQVAGNLALVLGASDGVYIAGGIARRYPAILGNSRFRSGFESKGRHRTLMESIPTQLVLYPEPGLLGAAYCALRTLRS
jgi:glucokinase